jgi:hypothetical protein
MSELTLQAARKIDPKRVALALGAIWAVFALIGAIVGRGYGAWGLQTFNPQHSSLDLQVSTTGAFTAFLLLSAAGLACALMNVDRARRRRQWRLVAWALLALGLDELLGVHSWLQSEGVSWNIAYAPVAALALVALLGAVDIFRSQRGAQAIFSGAILLWLAAALLDSPSIPGGEGGAEVLAMASAILFALALVERLRYLARQYYPLEEADTRLTVDQIAAEALNRLPIRGLAIALIAITALEAIQFLLFHDPGYPHCPAVLDPCHAREAAPIGILDLNNEQTLAATFQAGLLFAGGALAVVTSRLRATAADMKRWWLTLGVVMVVLGADQMVAVHSRFGDSTGVPGQLILLPFAIAGVLAWLKVLRAMWDNRLARTLFIAGACFWVFSQASDLLLDSLLNWTTTPEETSETTGSMLWMFSLLVWLRAALPIGLKPPEPAFRRRDESDDGATLITPLPTAGTQRARTSTG